MSFSKHYTGSDLHKISSPLALWQVKTKLSGCGLIH